MNSSSAAINISLFAILLLFAKSASSASAARFPSDSSDGSNGPGTPKPFPDPEMMQHLRQLFLGAKQLGRPLINGEMNLLPDRTKGFANSIRCFSDISATLSVQDSSRILQFNLSSLRVSDTIMAVDLVLKQPPNAPAYTTQLHEIVGESSGMDLKLLDSGEWDGEWHTLQVENMVDSMDASNRRRNYRLALSVSSNTGKSPMEEDLLHIVKPMLLVYTNNLNRTSESLGTKSPPSMGRNNMAVNGRGKETRVVQQDSIRRRRDVTGTQPMGTTTMAEESLDDLAQLPCQKNVRTITFDRLGWPGDGIVVVTPEVAQFSFCYGRCNMPLHSMYKHQYSNHAKVISITRPDLVAGGVTPCCVPVEYNPIEVTYIENNFGISMITMTSLPDITSCQCL